MTGAAWPEPRFEESGDQAIVDKLTGLVWARDANPAGGPKTWQESLDFIKTLNGDTYLGRSDWRLPNVNELESLVNIQPKLAEWLQRPGISQSPGGLLLDLHHVRQPCRLRLERRCLRRHRGRT